MIDWKAARADPDTWRAALARKDKEEDFDALLEADRERRSLLPEIEELRGRQKLKGKPAPEQLEVLARAGVVDAGGQAFVLLPARKARRRSVGGSMQRRRVL